MLPLWDWDVREGMVRLKGHHVNYSSKAPTLTHHQVRIIAGVLAFHLGTNPLHLRALID